jgi:hypothetical protein
MIGVRWGKEQTEAFLGDFPEGASDVFGWKKIFR